ncbi:MAG: DUF364 domain-containing protein [Methanoregula sp.]
MEETISQRKPCGDQVLNHTLRMLNTLYKENHIRPSRVSRIAIKPLWNIVIGSQNECGIAECFSENLALSTQRNHPEVLRLQGMVGKPLFEVAEQGISSGNLYDRSLAIAAMSALSQQFLGCSAIRKRGYHAQCWMAADSIVQQYPMISRLIAKDDVVALVGYDNLARNLRGHCKELHIVDKKSPGPARTVLIDHTVTYGPVGISLHSAHEMPDILGCADVVLIPASSLVDDSFRTLVNYAHHARIVGLYGMCGALIPDEFFMQGVDFITSFRIDNPQRFIESVQYDPDMADIVRMTQRHYLVMRPDADRGRPPADGCPV